MKNMLENLHIVDTVFVSIDILFHQVKKEERVVRHIYTMILSSIRKIWPYIPIDKQKIVYHTIKEYEKNILIYEQTKEKNMTLTEEIAV